ncbi:hypothetical protein F511_26639 [Dorcoceras hygrometricum]|uniref:Uncharacterized protein n=1 Tax=Dorcoceras hygrometricum TaxID=472368 RepID=A0A2Z7AFN9_9LAMI|nr:hypothetical protein F511_26639 [Dorcoceras hygrometricum]
MPTRVFPPTTNHSPLYIMFYVSLWIQWVARKTFSSFKVKEILPVCLWGLPTVVICTLRPSFQAKVLVFRGAMETLDIELNE